MLHLSRTAAYTLALALTLAGCTPSADGPASAPQPGPQPAGTGGAGPSGVGGAGGSAMMPPADPIRHAAGVLRRLTAQQYANSVRDLLGAGITVPPVEPDPSSDDEFVLTSVAVASDVLSPRAVDQYDAAARQLARQVLGDAARRVTFVGCTPASAEDACLRRFLAGFGRRAWRRPLADDELTRYVAAVSAVAQSRGDVWAGLETATAALLASPHFIYRVELGTPGAGGARTLVDHELATRLSFTLWDTTPDAALLDAADRGELGNVAVLRAHIERLLGSDRVRPPLLTFFSEWLGTSGLDKHGLGKDVKTFPAATAAMARAMFQEIEGMVGSLVFQRDADLMSLYETRETFLTAELATLYGLPAGAVPAGTTSSPFTLPAGPRGGLLTTGAFLSLNARASLTSPTLRGMFIRERLLCQHVPPPPPDVDTTLPPPPPGQVETMRERLQRHMTNPSCASCHTLMDPLGLALENFDALGGFRTVDGAKPIDTRGELDGRAFDGPQALARLLREHPDAAPCLASHLVQHLTGSADKPVAAGLARALGPAWKAAGGQLDGILTALLADPMFRGVGEAP